MQEQLLLLPPLPVVRHAPPFKQSVFVAGWLRPTVTLSPIVPEHGRLPHLDGAVAEVHDGVPAGSEGVLAVVARPLRFTGTDVTTTSLINRKTLSMTATRLLPILLIRTVLKC